MTRPNVNTKFAHEMAGAIEAFVGNVCSEMTMEEIMNDEEVTRVPSPSWKTLINRMDEREVEVLFKRLMDSVAEYDAYYNHDLVNIPPC
jgi:hypothetical protein